VSLEGELRVGLRVNNGRIAQTRITSTRPDVARSLLQGRTRAEVGTAVPLLFSLCGRSQAAASALALAAAAGEAASVESLARCAAAVSAETLRECAWRALLDWPREIGEQLTADSVAAARGSLAVRLEPQDEDPAMHAIALAAFGARADEWLALQTLAEFDRWADAGPTAASRLIRSLRDTDEALHNARSGRVEPGVALLELSQRPAAIVDLCDACAADPEFAGHPTWCGAPAETGALARLQADPLVSELLRRSASRVPARFVARLRELALLLTGRAVADVGAIALPSGCGIGWVENARGLLIHALRLEGERVGSYRIMAPTEWNFHPDGALALALTGSAAGDLDALRRRTTRLVYSLDPCVACRVEFDDA